MGDNASISHQTTLPAAPEWGTKPSGYSALPPGTTRARPLRGDRGAVVVETFGFWRPRVGIPDFEEVARQLEWSTSTIFRIETGRSRPQPGNVRTLLELYGVTGAERDGLIQLTREARQPGSWHSFRDVLPDPYEVYIGLEAGAASIRNFEPVVVPGLLQTADYAPEIIRNGPIELDPDEVERLLEGRQARQEILAREDRPRLWAVIDETIR